MITGWIALLLLFCVYSAGGQNNPSRVAESTDSSQPDSVRLSGPFVNTSLKDIFSQLEQQYPLRFFYKEEDLPIQLFSVSFQNEEALSAINRLLSTTDLTAMLFKGSAVIVAKRRAIEADYSAKFYESVTNGDQRLFNERKDSSYIEIGHFDNLKPSGEAFLQGIVTDELTSAPLSGCLVEILDHPQKAISDDAGRFQLHLPLGVYQLRFKHLGYVDQNRNLVVRNDGLFSVMMAEETYQLSGIVIDGKAPSMQSISGLSILSTKEIKAMPSLMGEPDVLGSLLYLPGVSNSGEGATGFNVRGGNSDENLILLGENMLFNAHHVFGLFGAIDPNVIKEVQLYRGAAPAYFGGRLASVLDIRLKEGSTEQFRLRGGLGPVSGNITAEIPLIREKSSVLLGGRSVYSDWILRQIRRPDVRQSAFFFYDVNLHYLYRVNDGMKVTAKVYSSQDDFRYAQEFGFDYRTNSINLTLSNIFRDRLSSTLDLTYNDYQSNRQTLTPNEKAGFDTGISYYKIKEHLLYALSGKLSLDMGGSFICYRSRPGAVYPLTSVSTTNAATLEDQQALESAAFASMEINLNEKLQIVPGLRLSHYNYLGPGRQFVYQNNRIPASDEIIDTLSFPRNRRIATYTTLEPRISVNYQLSKDHGLKAGYSRMAQYLYQLSNFEAAVPADIWTLSNTFLRPQRAHHFSLEYHRQLNENRWSGSIGVYFKQMTDLKDLLDFSNLIVNERLETDVVHVRGRAYGVEVNLRKNTGNLLGDLSYTWSRSERQSRENQLKRRINDNQWYFANYDQPHRLSAFLTYELNHRHRLAVTFNYSTGRPTTAPIGYFDVDNVTRIPIYSGRNKVRIPDYHRLDIAYTFGESAKRDKKWKTSWTFGLYNVYGRKNAFSLFFTQSSYSPIQANKLSILGSAFPALTFQFKTGDL